MKKEFQIIGIEEFTTKVNKVYTYIYLTYPIQPMNNEDKASHGVGFYNPTCRVYMPFSYDEIIKKFDVGDWVRVQLDKNSKNETYTSDIYKINSPKQHNPKKQANKKRHSKKCRNYKLPKGVK